MPKKYVVAALLAALAAAGGGCLWAPRPDPPTGAIHGRVLARGAQAPESEPREVVVYLEPLGALSVAAGEGQTATLRQADDDSWPLLAVAAGDRVRFQPHEPIHHRFFSRSEANAFELRHGEAAQLRHRGVVRFYCSLHPWESGLIFVTPSPWFTTSRAAHHYEIRDVPEGRYRLRTWSQAPQEPEQIVVVKPGESTAVDVELGASERRSSLPVTLTAD